MTRDAYIILIFALLGMLLVIAMPGVSLEQAL